MDLRGLCKVADAMKGLSTRGAIFCAIQINGCAVLAVDGCFGERCSCLILRRSRHLWLRRDLSANT
jgi:hypothetical protein